MAVSETLSKNLKVLRLSSMLRELERLQDDPGADGMTVEQYLDHLVSHELNTRQTRAIENRIRRGDFPAIFRLADYDFSRMPNLDKKFIVSLHECEWIGRGDNLVYAGGHGLGKTHLAISNGVEACEKGHKVLFTKVDQLILKLLEAREESRVLAFRKKLKKVDLLILDELGYTNFEKTGGELLHGVLCDRYEERKSVIVTTNLKFGRWVEVFKSKEMTMALLDRLTHRCDVILMEGESKRREESLARQRERETGKKKTKKKIVS